MNTKAEAMFLGKMVDLEEFKTSNGTGINLKIKTWHENGQNEETRNYHTVAVYGKAADVITKYYHDGKGLLCWCDIKNRPNGCASYSLNRFEFLDDGVGYDELKAERRPNYI